MYNRYQKVIIAAERAKQLVNGAQPRVEMPNTKSTRIAIAEVEGGLIRARFIVNAEGQSGDKNRKVEPSSEIAPESLVEA